MPSLNKILLMGHLGKDPELRYTANGKAVCSFSIAVDSGYGEKKKTVWWDVSVWDKQGETVKQYLAKGSLAFVEGETVEDEWEDKDTGAKRRAKKVVARDVRFMDSKPKDESSSPRAREPSSPPRQQQNTQEKETDLPFPSWARSAPETNQSVTGSLICVGATPNVEVDGHRRVTR